MRASAAGPPARRSSTRPATTSWSAGPARPGQTPGERAVIQSVGRAARILKALGSALEIPGEGRSRAVGVEEGMSGHG